MPAKGFKKHNINASKVYNSMYGYDDRIPDEMQFQTAISMPKSTYVQIDTIKQVTKSKSRSAIIANAIQFYLNYISKGE